MTDAPILDEIYVLPLPDPGQSYRDDALRDWRDTWRGPRPVAVKAAEMTAQVRAFLLKMETLLSEVPTRLGEYDLAEFEVSAGVTASGELVLFGVANVGGSVESGLKFVFKKRDQPA